MTSLARLLAPWHPAVAWALAAAAAVGIATAVSHGAHSGVRGALIVVLTWATVRELAPRRALPALLAPVAAVAYAIPERVDLLASLCVLLAARVASRSTGRSLTGVDCGVLVVLAGWAAARPAGLPAALVLAGVVFSSDGRARNRSTGALVLVAALVVGSTEGTITIRADWAGSGTFGLALLVVAAIGSALLVATRLPARLRARDDRRREPLRGPRVHAARVAAVASVAAAALWVGRAGVFELGAVTAAVAVCGLLGRTVPSSSRWSSTAAGSAHTSAPTRASATLRT